VLARALVQQRTDRSARFFRYICDNGTYIARYDDLFDGKENKIDVSKVDVSMNGIELQDREFFAAIREKREPQWPSNRRNGLPAMEALDRLEKVSLLLGTPSAR